MSQPQDGLQGESDIQNLTKSHHWDLQNMFRGFEQMLLFQNPISVAILGPLY